MKGRILWLAVADARGHLMRAHLMRRAMEGRAQVDIWTTSVEGARFLEAMGSPATVFSPSYRMVFDRHQHMRRRATERAILSYLLSPGRLARDLNALLKEARGYDLVVNDSFHPTLLFAPRLQRSVKVVQVHGETMLDAVMGHRSGHLGEGAYRSALGSLLRSSFAQVEHTLNDEPQPGIIRLPPLLAPVQRSAGAVRASLGLRPDQALAVVYLNPHFQDPILARVLRNALERSGYACYGVSEGVEGWRSYDPDLVSKIAAADLLVSAPGMAAMGLAKAHALPALWLSTRQPEQQRNLARWRRWRAPGAVIELSQGQLAGQLHRALTARRSARGDREGRRADRRTPSTTERWRGAFTHLLKRARAGAGDDYENCIFGIGDQQPQGRRSERVAHHGEPAAAVEAIAGANVSAVQAPAGRDHA